MVGPGGNKRCEATEDRQMPISESCPDFICHGINYQVLQSILVNISHGFKAILDSIQFTKLHLVKFKVLHFIDLSVKIWSEYFI